MRARVPGVLLALGGLVTILGLALGMFSLLGALSPAGGAWVSPGAKDVELSAGRWVVFEATSDTTEDPQTRPRQVSVYGPDGVVPVSCAYCSGRQTLTVNGQSYVGVVSFSVSDPGTYKVTVTSTGSTMVVAPGIGVSLLVFLGGLLVAAVGAVLAFISLAWLVIGGVTAPS